MANPYIIGSNSSAGAASYVVTANSSHNAADVIVVNVWTAASVTKVADSKGNSYVPANQNGGASQWVTTGKTVQLINTDTITVTLSASGAGNVTAVGVPGAIYSPVDAIASATSITAAVSVNTPTLISSDGQVALAMVASNASFPTWSSPWTGLGGGSHGLSPEWLQTACMTGVTGAITAQATVTANFATILVITLQMTSFVNASPVPPTQYAGQLAKSADMNTLAKTALSLRRPPMVIAQSATSGTGQSMTNVTAAISFASLQRDTDGFFATANPTRLTVQTPGFYNVRYSVPFAVAGQNCQAWIRVTTGANNPGGAGLTSTWWYSFAGAGNAIDGCVCGGGDIPVLLYAGDYVEIMANVVTTSNMPVSPQQAVASMRMVSV